MAELLTPREPLTDDRALAGRLLNWLLLASFPILLSTVAVRLALGQGLAETQNLALIALIAVGFLASLILRSGRVYLSGSVMMFALWAAGTAVIWMHPGFRETDAILTLVATLIAFLVLPWIAGLLLAVLSISSIWLLVVLEFLELRRTGLPNPADTGLALSAIFILVSIVAPVCGQILHRAVRQTVLAQQALSQSEKELSSILQRTPDIIYRLDAEGRITYVNEAVRRYGYDPSKMIGTHLLDYVHPGDREMARHRLDERRTGERRTKALEIRLLTSQGKERVAEYTAVPVFQEPVFLLEAEGLYENGTGPEHYVGTQGIARDVTDRKRAEEALKKSEEKYSKVFQGAPVGVAVASLNEARFLDVNEEFERTFGYGRNELIGRSAFDIGLWVNSGQREQIVNLLRRNEPAKDLEVQVRTKNGDVRTLRYNGQHIDIGGTTYLITTGVDITDRRRAEEALRKSEEKYSKVFQAAPAGFAVTSLDGARFFDVNEEFERIFGYRREEIIGRSALDIGSWVDPERREQIIYLMKRGELAKELEMQCRTKKGDPLTVRYNGQLIDFEGTACLLSAFQDITDRKRLESQLQQAQKLEAVGRLAGGIAHDFNNMLAVILGQAELVSRDLVPANPVYESIQEIRKAAERSAELIRQLLVFARRQDAAPQVLNLNQVMTERLGMLRRLIGENVALKCNPSPGLWPVKMDPAQVDQILINLAVNARDAIADVGTLILSTENRRKEAVPQQHGRGGSLGEWVVLTVTDTGTGMSNETLAHLFEPFFTTKEIGKGTGMGLATVYGIVQHNGGWIEVESQIGNGTTFRVYLPRAREEVISAGDGEQTQLAGGRETVLVVEDEPAILKITRTALQRLGYAVIEAGSARDALVVASQLEGPLHLLLTDVVMPEMNGRDLYERIATSHPGIRVIFMSGYSANVFQQLDDGKEDVSFLQKPFSVRQLSTKVREVLDPDQSNRSEDCASGSEGRSMNEPGNSGGTRTR